MMDYWSNFRCPNGVPLFNTIVLDEAMIANFGLRKLELSLYCMLQSVLRYLEPSVTDGRTDRQTDGLCHNKCHTSLGCMEKIWTADGWGVARARGAVRRD